MIGIKETLLFCFMLFIFLYFVVDGLKNNNLLLSVFNFALILLIIFFVFAMIGLLLISWQPDFPICSKGKCKRSWHYELLKEKSGNGRGFYKCRCGDIYINFHEKEEEFFMIIEKDKQIPYMKHSLFGRWKKDSG